MATDDSIIAAIDSFYAPKAKILVVDDTRLNLIVIKELLKQTGMQIDTANSGSECLFLAERSKYHIIFLDIRMPEMDGIETLRRLLLLDRYKDENIPIIALTANAINESIKEYNEEGFFDFLSKPVDLEMLEKVILKYLPRELVHETKSVKRNVAITDDRMDDIPNISGLDAAIGIQSCGTAEIFQKVLKEFYLTANERISELENYINTENYNDYTIKVHALKSSARIIGAMKLSETAQYLEGCGNKENICEIKLKTSELIEEYKELAESIGIYINRDADDPERPVLEWEQLMDAFHTIYEFVEIFDFDGADSVMEMLDVYKIPNEYYEAIKKLKILLIDVNKDGVLKHIKAVEQAHPKPAESDLTDIQELDVKSALDGLGGSAEAYINILEVFVKDELERINQMDECVRTEDIKTYTIYVHSLKSSAAIIGASELSDLAKQLEMVGKEGNFEYIRKNHNEFSVKTNHLIEKLNCFLQQRRNSENHGKELGEKDILLESLVKIEQALTDYEIDIAEDILKMLDNMQWSNAISIMLSEIGQKILTFDYENAQSLIGKLLRMEEK